MKIREKETIPVQGRVLCEIKRARIIDVDEAPEGAEIVDDATPVSDWVEVN